MSRKDTGDIVFRRLMMFFACMILVIVLGILFELTRSSLPSIKKFGLSFLFTSTWDPVFEKFGALPFIYGTLVSSFVALLLAIPIGLGAAIYLAEYSPWWVRNTVSSLVDLLAAIPSVVLGFVGMVTLVPWVRSIFHLPTGLTALSGSIMLAFMAMPTIVSIAEDALYSVPKSYKEGALALGATHWQTITRVMLPAASSGILAAIMLGIGRVIGETMAVMMITGNSAVIPRSIFQPVRTLTATIAAEMGEAVVGSEHYFALFAIGIVLFVISFAINVTADLFLHRAR